MPLVRPQPCGIINVDMAGREPCALEFSAGETALPSGSPRPLPKRSVCKTTLPLTFTSRRESSFLSPHRRPPTLEQLLDGVRKSNLHGEVDTGPAQGREAW
jgi:hypothetical protein